MEVHGNVRQWTGEQRSPRRKKRSGWVGGRPVQSRLHEKTTAQRQRELDGHEQRRVLDKKMSKRVVHHRKTDSGRRGGGGALVSGDGDEEEEEEGYYDDGDEFAVYENGDNGRFDGRGDIAEATDSGVVGGGGDDEKLVRDVFTDEEDDGDDGDTSSSDRVNTSATGGARGGGGGRGRRGRPEEHEDEQTTTPRLETPKADNHLQDAQSKFAEMEARWAQRVAASPSAAQSDATGKLLPPYTPPFAADGIRPEGKGREPERGGTNGGVENGYAGARQRRRQSPSTAKEAQKGRGGARPMSREDAARLMNFAVLGKKDGAPKTAKAVKAVKTVKETGTTAAAAAAAAAVVAKESKIPRRRLSSDNSWIKKESSDLEI